MAFKYPTDLGQEIKGIIKEITGRNKLFDIYVINDINEETYTVNITHPTIVSLQHSNVKLLSTVLGNFKGFMCLPEVNDHVLVLFLDERTPIIIGSIFSQYDTIPAIDKNEMLLCPKEKGSYIFFDKNNNIKIKSGNNTITIKDGVININGGSAGIARTGDAVSVTVPTIGVCTGTITGGSNTAKCG